MRKVMLALLALTSAAVADPLPTTRRTDWTYAGVPGGVPNRTTVCATFSPGASASAINNALSACNNGVVQLNAGAYSAASLGGTIHVYNKNVTLRGAGADKTVLTGLDVINLGNGWNVSLGVAITAGGSKGSKTITVASTANLAAGTMIEIDRDDDPALVVNTGNQGGGRRNITQLNMITAVSGNTLTLRNPMFYDFSTGNPAIKNIFRGITQNSGVEALKIDHAGFSGGSNFNVNYCDSCWLKGVESATSTGYHFVMLGTLNLELRDSYVHDGGSGPNNSGFNFYGNYSYGANSNARIENNIFNRDFPAIELNGSSSGFAVSYNYVFGSSVNGVSWTLDDGHAPFNIMNLYEGNVGEMWGADNYFGGTGYGTALRNYFTGYNPNFTAAGDAVILDRLAYNYNLIGNVLGSAKQAGKNYVGCNGPSIYRLGYPNLGNCSPTPWDGFTPPSSSYPDQKVASTLLRWGNYDYVNKSTRFVAAEIPADVATPTDQVIPNSYAYPSKPGWWNAGVAWPPIGPDVTGGNGDATGHVNKIPAQLCWESSNLASGGSFSASTCYLSSSIPRSPATPAPVISSALNATGTVAQPFNYTITATNNPTAFTAVGLPSALSLNATTGVISGTPAATSASSVTLSARNATGTGSATLILTINAPTSLLLGSQTIQPTVDFIASGTAEAFRTTARASGAVSALSVYIDASSTANVLVAGIYRDAGGRPGSLISQGRSSASLTRSAWNRVTIPAAAVTAGAKYWLAVLGANGGALGVRDGLGCTSETSRLTTLTALPATWSTGVVWPNSCGLAAFGK